jgi:hypothetical protein
VNLALANRAAARIGTADWQQKTSLNTISTHHKLGVPRRTASGQIAYKPFDHPKITLRVARVFRFSLPDNCHEQATIIIGDISTVDLARVRGEGNSDR